MSANAEEEESNHEWIVFMEPHKASVGDALDGYLLCTNSVFILAGYSLIMGLIHIIIHGRTPTESLEILIDVATIITAIISIRVAFTGSNKYAGLIVGIMLLRFTSWILCCYLVIEEVYHPYHIMSKIGMAFNAFLSFMTLTYYGIFAAKLAAADDDQLLEGLRQAEGFRKNRKEIGKNHPLLNDIINMSEYDLIADYVVPSSEPAEGAKDYGSTKAS
mmetsp:Transcript_143274/g.260113  ORF Transcript_143274/g.260113 Transcript_143274/m.260113 type:complete len:218 (-) Transcript_143274:96-749(-)